MAVPKRKTSKAKRDSRRAQNMKKTVSGISICPKCKGAEIGRASCRERV